MNNRMFDVASGPTLLASGSTLLTKIGIPIIIIVVVVVLVFVASKLIKNARKKNLEANRKPDNNDSSNRYG